MLAINAAPAVAQAGISGMRWRQDSHAAAIALTKQTAAIEDAIRHFNNVCGQIAIVLRAKKPLR